MEKEAINSAIQKATGLNGDFHSDLNACHEMEKNLLNEQRRNYVELLIAIHPLHYDFRTSDDSRMAAYFIVNATAPQRCEAFLRCLGLWE